MGGGFRPIDEALDGIEDDLRAADDDDGADDYPGDEFDTLVAKRMFFVRGFLRLLKTHKGHDRRAQIADAIDRVRQKGHGEKPGVLASQKDGTSYFQKDKQGIDDQSQNRSEDAMSNADFLVIDLFVVADESLS